MFSGWGIRTLSSDHRFYNPLSYHRGTVWAVEQATTIFGLRRFGFDARANDLARAFFDLAALYPEHRIPECVGGFPRATHPSPGAYPQANAPQLWNATGVPLIAQTLAGIVPLAPYETLIVDPALPDWLPSSSSRTCALVPRRGRCGSGALPAAVRRFRSSANAAPFTSSGSRRPSR